MGGARRRCLGAPPPRGDRVARPFTAGWPLLRRGLLEVGRALKSAGTLGDEGDVVFLTREEMEGADDLRTGVEERKKIWQRQRRLTPPRQIGTAPRIWQLAQRMMPQGFGDAAKEELHPRSLNAPETATYLVAPATAPAWTPLFARVAAVVTDTGSPMAHASLVARE